MDLNKEGKKRSNRKKSPAEQWYLTCQYKAFLDMQYFLKQFCCLSLIKLHIVQGVNNVQKMPFHSFFIIDHQAGHLPSQVHWQWSCGTILVS
jgi:hypothetical protein